MSLTITQTPATASLAQSPMVFTVSESSGVINSSSFQYNCDLFYWNGVPSQSGSSQYTLVKYPNVSTVGIFDVSRIINSTLTDLAEENPSNIKFYKGEFYWTFLSSSQFVSSSKVSSPVYAALDGYAIFPEPINQQLNLKSPFFPFLTDGPVTQSVLNTNIGELGVWVGIIPSGALQPTKAVYSDGITTVDLPLTASVSSSQQVDRIPFTRGEVGFPLSGSGDYTIQIFGGSTAIGNSIRFEEVCKRKYPNVRIKWKNRYGQFDWFNFNMVSKEAFQVQTKTYQPQLGSWTGTSLSYNGYDSSKLNYVSDSSQTLRVNTDWVSEDYNDIFKQLMVSDEIYWIYDESGDNLRPITIKTETIEFKTGVVDKLIQYAFDFDFGQQYKLII
jgi:hypothetical protein